MFSIAHFIFGSKEALTEGGNTRALERDPATGYVIGKKEDEKVKTFRGRPGFAEEIDLKSGRISRDDLRRDIVEMLKVLDSEFEKDHGEPIWDSAQRDDILGTGFAFTGSSTHLFASSTVMPDEKFIEFKPEVGDVDLMVPGDRMKGLFKTLHRLEDKQLTPKIAYIGHNKRTEQNEYNALFAYTWDPSAPEGEGDVFFQIDFNGSKYKESGRPSEWDIFAHSSSWRDIEMGVKGLAHKILLFSIAAVKNPPPVNARLATPTATAENPKISMKTDDRFIQPSPEEIESRIQDRISQITSSGVGGSPSAIRKRAEAEIKSEINAAKRKPAKLKALKTIDLASGYGERYVKLDWKYNGDDVYRYLSRAERTNTTREVDKVFSGLFGENPPATEKELNDFESFIGILDIMKNRMSPPEIVKTYEHMVFWFFGSGAQKISATSSEKDRNVKERILEVFRQVLPDAESSTVDVESLKSDYYAKYKVRGQEGYTEDSVESGDVDESLLRSKGRLFEIFMGR